MDNGSRSDPLFRHRDDRGIDQITGAGIGIGDDIVNSIFDRF
jgi:hypothetical protein